MSYAGDLSPGETYQLLAANTDAVLVDVRTAAEWAYVGLPDLSGLGREVARIEWVSFPDGRRNDAFLEDLAAIGPDRNAPVAFLCRSGVRSKSAAIAPAAAGYRLAYNISDGFEGQLDEAGHRGVGGWKASGLPWRQS